MRWALTPPAHLPQAHQHPQAPSASLYDCGPARAAARPRCGLPCRPPCPPTHPRHHGAVEPPVDGDNGEAKAHHHGHHALERHAPPVNAGRQVGADLRGAGWAGRRRSSGWAGGWAGGQWPAPKLAYPSSPGWWVRAYTAGYDSLLPPELATAATKREPNRWLQPRDGPAPHLREHLDRAAGEDERNVGAQAEERVEVLRLLHRRDLRRGGSSTPARQR